VCGRVSLMRMLPVALAPSSPRSSLLAAYNQWSNANFSGCLEELDHVASSIDGAELLEARLLRARVYARVDRPLDALQQLNIDDAALRDDFDAQCSLISLRGHALSLAGRHEEAIANLQIAVEDSRKNATHPSVQLEALYMLAFAHWLAEEYDVADDIAARAIESNGDIIAARAIALRGWIAVGRAQYERALGLFRDAWGSYASASARDAGFAASTIHALAMYDLKLIQHGDNPLYYSDHVPAASASTLDAFRLLVHEIDAWRAATAGDEYRAIESSIKMDSLDVSPHWRVYGAATRAMIADAVDQSRFSRAFANAGFSDAQNLDWNESPAESRTGLLYLAEGLAPHDVVRAQTIVKVYSRIQTAVLPRFFRGKSVLQRAIESFSRGVVAKSAADPSAARQHLRTAHQGYSEMGFLRNATAAQLLLGEERTAEGRRHYRAARAIIVERFPRSYLARRLKDFMPCPVTGTAIVLTPAQRYIVGALCAGRTPSEIARGRGTSLGTVYNQIKEIYRRTDLHSIQAVVTRFGRATA
jgi:DNA-binding CsgD family transcriptional regulator/tetratricopeptide (TPR) repeat protein